MPVFLLLFIVIPLIEIALFIQVGDEIGALATVGLIILTAAIGVLLLRWQGLATLLRARSRMASGELPAREMIEGILLAIAGAFLLTPGFFTDTLGFLLLIPQGRRWLVQAVGSRVSVHGASMSGRGPYAKGQGEHTFEGEYQRTDSSTDSAEPTDSPKELPKK
ncbi:FxsA family protein [Gilvimarinus chinensis]|uniref:FxsA family protein n=1 Tax=Gilvimarinus chinensis TaxID=396005 RepID=UPI00037EA71D|nr:FxsA family protein [Gilvimarinus chinensis]